MANIPTPALSPSPWRPVLPELGELYWLESLRSYRFVLKLENELEPDPLRVVAALTAGGWGPVQVWRPASAPKDWPPHHRESPIPKLEPGKMTSHSFSVVYGEGIWIGKQLGIEGVARWPVPPKSELLVWEMWRKDPEPSPPAPEPSPLPSPARPTPRSSGTSLAFAFGAAATGVGLVLLLRASKSARRRTGP